MLPIKITAPPIPSTAAAQPVDLEAYQLVTMSKAEMKRRDFHVEEQFTQNAQVNKDLPAITYSPNEILKFFHSFLLQHQMLSSPPYMYGSAGTNVVDTSYPFFDRDLAHPVNIPPLMNPLFAVEVIHDMIVEFFYQRIGATKPGHEADYFKVKGNPAPINPQHLIFSYKRGFRDDFIKKLITENYFLFEVIYEDSVITCIQIHIGNKVQIKFPFTYNFVKPISRDYTCSIDSICVAVFDKWISYRGAEAPQNVHRRKCIVHRPHEVSKLLFRSLLLNSNGNIIENEKEVCAVSLKQIKDMYFFSVGTKKLKLAPLFFQHVHDNLIKHCGNNESGKNIRFLNLISRMLQVAQSDPEIEYESISKNIPKMNALTSFLSGRTAEETKHILIFLQGILFYESTQNNPNVKAFEFPHSTDELRCQISVRYEEREHYVIIEKDPVTMAQGLVESWQALAKQFQKDSAGLTDILKELRVTKITFTEKDKKAVFEALVSNVTKGPLARAIAKTTEGLVGFFKSMKSAVSNHLLKGKLFQTRFEERLKTNPNPSAAELHTIVRGLDKATQLDTSTQQKLISLFVNLLDTITLKELEDQYEPIIGLAQHFVTINPSWIGPQSNLLKFANSLLKQEDYRHLGLQLLVILAENPVDDEISSLIHRRVFQGMVDALCKESVATTREVFDSFANIFSRLNRQNAEIEQQKQTLLDIQKDNSWETDTLTVLRRFTKLLTAVDDTLTESMFPVINRTRKGAAKTNALLLIQKWNGLSEKMDVLRAFHVYKHWVSEYATAEIKGPQVALTQATQLSLLLERVISHPELGQHQEKTTEIANTLLKTLELGQKQISEQLQKVNDGSVISKRFSTTIEILTKHPEMRSQAFVIAKYAQTCTLIGEDDFNVIFHQRILQCISDQEEPSEDFIKEYANFLSRQHKNKDEVINTASQYIQHCMQIPLQINFQRAVFLFIHLLNSPQVGEQWPLVLETHLLKLMTGLKNSDVEQMQILITCLIQKKYLQQLSSPTLLQLNQLLLSFDNGVTLFQQIWNVLRTNETFIKDSATATCELLSTHTNPKLLVLIQVFFIDTGCKNLTLAHTLVKGCLHHRSRKHLELVDPLIFETVMCSKLKPVDKTILLNILCGYLEYILKLELKPTELQKYSEQLETFISIAGPLQCDESEKRRLCNLLNMLYCKTQDNVSIEKAIQCFSRCPNLHTSENVLNLLSVFLQLPAEHCTSDLKSQFLSSLKEAHAKELIILSAADATNIISQLERTCKGKVLHPLILAFDTLKYLLENSILKVSETSEFQRLFINMAQALVFNKQYHQLQTLDQFTKELISNKEWISYLEKTLASYQERTVADLRNPNNTDLEAHHQRIETGIKECQALNPLLFKYSIRSGLKLMTGLSLVMQLAKTRDWTKGMEFLWQEANTWLPQTLNKAKELKDYDLQLHTLWSQEGVNYSYIIVLCRSRNEKAFSRILTCFMQYVAIFNVKSSNIKEPLKECVAAINEYALLQSIAASDGNWKDAKEYKCYMNILKILFTRLASSPLLAAEIFDLLKSQFLGYLLFPNVKEPSIIVSSSSAAQMSNPMPSAQTILDLATNLTYFQFTQVLDDVQKKLFATDAVRQSIGEWIAEIFKLYLDSTPFTGENALNMQRRFIGAKDHLLTSMKPILPRDYRSRFLSTISSDYNLWNLNFMRATKKHALDINKILSLAPLKPQSAASSNNNKSNG